MLTFGRPIATIISEDTTMTYGMFLILCFLIVACGHRSPEKKGILDGIDTSEPTIKDFGEWLRNYGKE